MNMAGVSKASVHSASLECKEWTITVPGMTDNIFTKTIINAQKIGLVDIREETII